ncbi:hypothetical protein PAXINDRAFT_169467 [Paxillus involutus ATCC 200175]|uniref:Unplaced genomic scaffold PAXINscaffold_18, whole genome shotgun sequence n=1 Tax=Paxillus involutus ATCC 200175 TaxID=664439 RepID=A0A0C9TGH0_PAXIN|nr:hypothetical protein PAXINDRAFT_169467 [Paxillus involutus ATCC 200175]
MPLLQELDSQDVIVSPLTSKRRPQIAFHTRRYSPVQSIPIELLSEIFIFASHSPDGIQGAISQPITISHVCNHWRQVSLSTPSLWTTIFLALPLSKNQLTRTITWIFRSRNRPLHIHMDFRDPSWNWDEASHSFGWKAMENIMRLILPQAPHWHCIELLTDTWAPIFTFLSYTARVKSAPLLQNIRLARCNEYFAAKGEPFRPANLALPVAWFGGGAGLCDLRQLSLSGVHIDWINSGLRGLKELELKYHAQQVMPTLPEFMTIMDANPGLERLVILGWGPKLDPGSQTVLQTIQLPQLREFEFGFVDVDYAVDLLSMFYVPNLRVLSIEDVASDIRPSQSQDCSRLFDYISFVNETDSPRIPLSSLLSLSLRGIRAGNASICQFLGHLCSIESLSVIGVDAVPLRALCSTLHACPTLSTLTLKDVDGAAVALAFPANSFPPGLRIVIDTCTDRDDFGDM